jgi:FixJ family two-component response regulator
MTGNPSIVMIVDDDVSIRKAVRRLMKSYGFVVEAFASAEEFLGSDGLDKASCLILDVRMPGMNGLDLQRRVIESGCVIPIVFITAFADDHTRAQAVEGGAVGYLAKPFDDEELLNCIHTALRYARREALRLASP